jgi:decaprenylphospho-beta-D-ribofuranose 2-oxidase
MLSFPMPGFALALDFPNRPATVEMIRRLYDITLKHGGRVYLAKDACMTAEQMEAMYPALAQFRSVMSRIDPRGVMQSDMSRRLRLGARQAS